ncbi:amidase domain-containing protein [Microterricola pindariensis]|uniref:IPT/TIG domain-containing protein n=1 Tax=Microterricola pindariensis TaxID=478010 RepID=A0ABX5AVJ4_9MICO|nr:amidase domain-containing protein [Microterricola pindariensis]PPL18933.1 hypothetical protein GY24_08665 [Microterricola pindariensis]
MLLTLPGHRRNLAGGAAGLAAVACGLLVVGLGTAPTGAQTASAADAFAKPDTTRRAAPANTVTPIQEPVKVPVALATPAVASGPVTGGTVVTVAGEELNQVSAVQVGGVPAVVVEATPTALSYQVPVAAELATGTVSVELFDGAGAAVPTADPVALEAEAAAQAAEKDAAKKAAAAQAADPTVPVAAPAAFGRPAAEYGSAELRSLVLKPGVVLPALPAAAAAAPALLSFEYLPDPRVTAQTDYVLQYWANYNPAYIAINGNDCVNFTSQGLLARGWEMDGEWNYGAAGGSATWVSSTAFHNYMAAHPERGIALGDDQRASVKVGDIAQFDWDNSGDRDHTSTVTRVDKTADGVTIYVAGHSKDSDYWNVDQAIAGGGSVSYWSLS